MRREGSGTDREELALFESFLRVFGKPGAPVTAADAGRRRAWVAEDGERRRRWLGLTEERALALGYQPADRNEEKNR